jgi:hypothetical protein
VRKREKTEYFFNRTLRLGCVITLSQRLVSRNYLIELCAIVPQLELSQLLSSVILRSMVQDFAVEHCAPHKWLLPTRDALCGEDGEWRMKVKQTEFQPNSYVLVHYRSDAPPSGLHTFWRGPMHVVSGKDSRFVKDLISHKEKEYHVSDMNIQIRSVDDRSTWYRSSRSLGVLYRSSLWTSRRPEIQERSWVSCQMVKLRWIWRFLGAICCPSWLRSSFLESSKLELQTHQWYPWGFPSHFLNHHKVAVSVVCK